MSAIALPLRRWPSRQPVLFLRLAAIAWFGLHQTLLPASEALVARLPVDRAFACMMSVIALSAPEVIIRRKVLKPRLMATFFGVVATGILLVGFVFNAVL